MDPVINEDYTSDDTSVCSDVDKADIEYQDGNSGNDDAMDGDDEKIQLAKKETETIFRLRLLVFFVLLLAALGVSIVVYFITANALEDEYKTQYEGAAKKVNEIFLDIIESKLGAVSSMGVALIAHGVDHLRKWPLVTLSSFQQRSAAARSQSGALYIMVNPMVDDDNRAEWENYTKTETGWIAEGMKYQEYTESFDFMKESAVRIFSQKGPQPDSIWYYDQNYNKVLDEDPGPYFPTWETSPLFDEGKTVNENILRSDGGDGASAAYKTGHIMISEFVTAPPGGIDSDNFDTAWFSLLLSAKEQKIVRYEGDPMSRVFFPIFNNFDDDRKTVAVMVAWINWASYFKSSLPETVRGVVVVLSDSCGGLYTFKINGERVIFLGQGDRHDSQFDDKKKSSQFHGGFFIPDGTKGGLPLSQVRCQIKMDVYPSQEFLDSYSTNTPILITMSVAFVFIFTACTFLLYDRLVERRQALVLRKAIESTAIVSSLFPENVRDRLMKSKTDRTDDRKAASYVNPTNRLKGYLNGASEDSVNDQPIADLFPNCTVLFADIAGFTAWSSSRDPGQVFVLLQQVYQAFDSIAKRRKVFKVETIGDSYVAVTGLPEQQPNHAIIMARFACECMTTLQHVVSELEYTLGPDTGELTMRCGLHSGPVTAGVLRGERARFQLFGDTVNTAARMESTGIKGKIQVSVETHDLIVEAGKSHWVQPRADAVKAKGKGILRTFWLDVQGKKPANIPESSSESDIRHSPTTVLVQNSLQHHGVKTPSNIHKLDRLIEWMVDILKEQIKVMLAHRDSSRQMLYKPCFTSGQGKTALDEVAEVILLPRFNAVSMAPRKDVADIELDPAVQAQLREYVGIVASAYRDNPFHNFEHACHVTMATKKFLKRVVTPQVELEEETKNGTYDEIASKLHYYTHGINSDPLTGLAILFSALIHDIDHRGVSNAQLIKEEPEMGAFYHNKSVAEQNSFDIAWNLLMSEQFSRLQSCLFTSQEEIKRFRQVVVNVVLATDIFDAELNDLRKKRWEKAFSNADVSDDQLHDLRATIVIEHIIQASDVAHTMQHWHVYRKWNRKLFEEMYSAYKNGRMEKDPCEFWYQGELAFFDKYVIPLAKKLKDCNVFGVSSDECLNYAINNRTEWQERGEEVIAAMIRELKDSDSTNNESEV